MIQYARMQVNSNRVGCSAMRIEPLNVNTTRGKLQVHIRGNGTPRIVMINGGSGPMEGWMRILPEISESSSLLVYNRFGVAGSDKPTVAQDGRTIVETLREALSLVGFDPPYLLVGHSLGGLYANLYARLYPDEVAGMVLIESSHPKDIDLNAYQGKFVKALNKLLSMFVSFSPHHQYNEVHFVHRTAEQIEQNSAFPNIPLYVITGGKENRMIPEEARKLRLENQKNLLTLSTSSKHIIAEKSGHFPQLTEPKVVIDAIRACIDHMNQTTQSHIT